MWMLWAGLSLVCGALCLDFVLFSSDGYTQTMLFIWTVLFAALALLVRSDRRS